MRSLLMLCAVGFGFAACDGEASTAPTPDVTAADATVSGPEVVASAVDTGSGPSDVTAPMGELILGVNETGRNTPEYFRSLAEGGELNVEFGPQGLWMVVLAFRTHDLLQAPLFLDGQITLVDGAELLGRLQLAQQPLFPGGDGWDYYYNLFLVVEVVGRDVAGQRADITLTLRSAEGTGYIFTRRVVLTGGPGAG